MRQVRAKKSLGQHFLNDMGIAERIASTVDVDTSLPVLEVGPGMGVLTQFLLAHGRDVTVVELDRDSVAYLRQRYPAELGDGRLIEGDFLKLDLAAVFGDRPFAITGNYPYNISSQIFFKLLDYRDQVPLCTGMVQREVAQRIAAPAGNRTRGILSVLLQAWYDIEYLFTVDEHVFTPPPKVKSGVIRLRRNDVTDLGCPDRLFKTVVKTAFGQRRKTLRNSLRSLVPATAPAELLRHPLFELRPERLEVADFVTLTNMIHGAQAGAITNQDNEGI